MSDYVNIMLMPALVVVVSCFFLIKLSMPRPTGLMGPDPFKGMNQWEILVDFKNRIEKLEQENVKDE